MREGRTYARGDVGAHEDCAMEQNEQETGAIASLVYIPAAFNLDAWVRT